MLSFVFLPCVCLSGHNRPVQRAVFPVGLCRLGLLGYGPNTFQKGPQEGWFVQGRVRLRPQPDAVGVAVGPPQSLSLRRVTLDCLDPRHQVGMGLFVLFAECRPSDEEVQESAKRLAAVPAGIPGAVKALVAKRMPSFTVSKAPSLRRSDLLHQGKPLAGGSDKGRRGALTLTGVGTSSRGEAVKSTGSWASEESDK